MGKFSQPRGPVPEDDSYVLSPLAGTEEISAAPEAAGIGEAFGTAQVFPAPPKSKSSAKKKNRKVVLISLCSVAAVLLISVIVALVYLFAIDPNEGRILNNVSVAGVNVGNMTKSEAKAAIRAATDNTYTQQDMVIDFPDLQLRLSPADTGAALDVNAAVDAAYEYGRTGTAEEKENALAASMNAEHPVALLPYLTLDLDYIRQELEDYGKSFNSVYAPSSAELDGEMPILDADAEGFDPNAACQNLVIELGNPGRYINIDNVYNRVLDAYSFNQFHLTVEMDEEETVPEEIDLEEIHARYFLAPQDATVDEETYEVVMEVYGYDFDIDAAAAALEQAQYGDTVTVPMQLIVPEKLGGPIRDVLFRDILAEYKTEHTNEKNRNTNLELACAAINGLILDPGEIFDYNTVVGERTSAKGYKSAAAYSSGKTVQSIGGGVCQVSSTIYYCCLVSDMEIVNRLPHSYVSSYMPMGMDATVSWGGPEFTFKNNTNYPIRIETWVADGYVHCKLVGTDEKDYYIEMEYEVTGTNGPTTVYEEYPPDNKEGYKDGEVIQTAYKGYWVNTYKNKYSKETGELIVREFDQQSIYKKRDKIIAKIVQPTEPPTEPPTAPPTEAPAESPAETPAS